jgi:hypothetical protein
LKPLEFALVLDAIFDNCDDIDYLEKICFGLIQKFPQCCKAIEDKFVNSTNHVLGGAPCR